MYGLDAAAAAAFLGLLWPRLNAPAADRGRRRRRLRRRRAHPVAAAGLPVLAAALVAVVVGLTNWLARKEDQQ